MATGLVLTVLKLYRAYAQVFSEADPESMPSHDSQVQAIELLNGKQSLRGLIDNWS